VAPLKERIAALSHRLSISEKEATRQVRTIDRERTDFIQDHFFKDPTDPQYFDLVLNAGRLPVAALAEIIIDTLHQLQAAAAGTAGTAKKDQGGVGGSERGSHLASSR
jgi:cytidylate kinase